jgi:PST family polysaccharide transporter
MLPFFVIHSALIERENRLKITALSNAVQGGLSNIITVALAILGQGVWAIVFAMLFSTPAWIIITWANHTWRPPKRITLNHWKEIIDFGKNLLGVELLNRLRSNLDYLVVGKFLGIEALGLYYFAFNAGLGITMNVINTFMTALFPYICNVRNNYEEFKARYLSSLKKTAYLVIPLILLQSFLAPIYVPIIFGQRWVSSVPIMILICLSVIPRIYGWGAYILLNAIDKTYISFRIEFCFTIVFTFAILIGVQNGIFGVAIAVLISHVLFLLPSSAWIHRYALNEEKHFLVSRQI